MNLKDTYNKIAKDWVTDHNNDTWGEGGTDVFLSYLNKESKILDAGCGGGVKTRHMKEKGFKNVKGIDFSEGMIDVAKQSSSDISFEVADLYTIETEEKFDGIFMQAVLLHFPKKHVLQILTRVKEKLNSGGVLYVAVKEVKNNEEENMRVENDYGYEYERFFSYFTFPELEEYFKQLGMEILWQKNIFAGKANWLQIIARK